MKVLNLALFSLVRTVSALKLYEYEIRIPAACSKVSRIRAPGMTGKSGK
jgi:hypothetical protein